MVSGLLPPLEVRFRMSADEPQETSNDLGDEESFKHISVIQPIRQ